MMDKRFILYIAAGFIIFALWGAWQNDYNKTAIAPIANAISNSSATNSINTASLQSSSQVPNSRLVNIHTDVLDVAIDTLGGNVVKADLLKYPEAINQPEPVKLFSDDPNSYYVAQSGIISAQGPDGFTSQAQYNVEQTNYSLQSKNNNLVVKLSWNDGKGLVINKVFTFIKGKYSIDVDYEIINNSNQPFTGQYYSQITRKNVEPKRSTFGFSTYTGAAISSADKPYEKISYAQMDKEKLDREIQGGWVAMQQRYFLSAWIPNQEKAYKYYSNANDKVYSIGFSNGSINVPAKQKNNINSTLYVGPEITENLKSIAKGLDLTIDYGWLSPISILIFAIMKKIFLLVRNWGWAIIIVTLLIKLLFYKLSESSCMSMAKMRELAPKLQDLKERCGDDKQKLSQATMELYRKEKVNPLGGCLPMLVQIPFFIALYYVLIEAVELRQAPFMFWIHDLSVKDPYFILPILMGLSMFLQQRLTPSTPDPAQAKMMLLMPVIFTVFFLQFPSGLVLYWLVNSCLSILQQWYINKKVCRLPAKK